LIHLLTRPLPDEGGVVRAELLHESVPAMGCLRRPAQAWQAIYYLLTGAADLFRTAPPAHR
jgi:hypothetical protein